LTRGSKSLSVQGGPDTLRAIYGETQKNGTLKAVAGDGLVVFVEWSKNGTLKSQSIHQYGSATQDIMSDHYDDQIEIFAEERLKETYFHTEALELHTEKKYSVPHKK
jgi:penicillin amidase/acyl-homoserine-lactone acylase